MVESSVPAPTSGIFISVVGGGIKGGGGCDFFAAADIAVLWNSIVPGVAPPKLKSCDVDGDGTGNMEPDPPGVSPLRIPDSFGVRPDRMWAKPKSAVFVGP